MKNKKVVLHFLLYLGIILGLVFLYHPFVENAFNDPSSMVQFVYAKF